MHRVRVYITGKVQRVFFRASTKRKAEGLGLGGWVRNLADGRVEAVFEGETDSIDGIIEWCKKGSPGSEVEDVEVAAEPKGHRFNGFRHLADTD
jgi:acylphosphatase